jgi:hypothetical protein
MVQESLADHDRQVRGEAAPALEPSDDCEIILAELETHIRGEIVGIVVANAVPPANRPRYLIDRREVLSEEGVGVHASLLDG